MTARIWVGGLHERGATHGDRPRPQVRWSLLRAILRDARTADKYSTISRQHLRIRTGTGTGVGVGSTSRSCP